MGDGKWSGSGLTRRWARPGSRRDIPGDLQRAARLFSLLALERFWCDNCGRMHPLQEHRQCREEYPFRTAYRGM